MTKQVTRYTRAPRGGRTIVAPCGKIERVYHFSWSALLCSICGDFHDKKEYALEEMTA
jgi:hypothetical protein